MNLDHLKSERRIKYIKLLEIIKGGEKFGIKIPQIENKIRRCIDDVDNEFIRVALVGGFSEGKTTVVAGWIGEVESNMKIDPDESSDEIQFYHPQSVDNAVEIVDTPGLYGDKEFKNGQKYSDKTTEYISEAHLILFILNPVNPLKESHAETVKWLFRDLNKIDSVVFVLNKMDEVANLNDEEDFQECFNIKKINVLDYLERTINLTKDERKRVNITAVAANPKGKGLDFWLKREPDYLKRSRLNLLRSLTSDIISNSYTSLVYNKDLSVIKDIVKGSIDEMQKELSSVLMHCDQLEKSLEIFNEEYNSIYRQIVDLVPSFKEELILYKNSIVVKFHGSDISTIGLIYEEEIGNDGINLSTRINNIYQKYFSQITLLSTTLFNMVDREIKFNEELTESKDSTFMKDGTKFVSGLGTKGLHTAIKTSKNLMNKFLGTSIKFKPWGITKLANSISAGATVIGFAVEIYETVKVKNKQDKFIEEKKKLVCSIQDIFDEQLKSFSSDDVFISMFAPGLLELKKNIEMIGEQLNLIKSQKQNIENWGKSISNSSDIEDVLYQEV